MLHKAENLLLQKNQISQVTVWLWYITPISLSLMLWGIWMPFLYSLQVEELHLDFSPFFHICISKGQRFIWIVSMGRGSEIRAGEKIDQRERNKVKSGNNIYHIYIYDWKNYLESGEMVQHLKALVVLRESGPIPSTQQLTTVSN